VSLRFPLCFFMRKSLFLGFFLLRRLPVLFFLLVFFFDGYPSDAADSKGGNCPSCLSSGVAAFTVPPFSPRHASVPLFLRNLWTFLSFSPVTVPLLFSDPRIYMRGLAFFLRLLTPQHLPFGVFPPLPAAPGAEVLAFPSVAFPPWDVDWRLGTGFFMFTNQAYWPPLLP